MRNRPTLTYVASIAFAIISTLGWIVAIAFLSYGALCATPGCRREPRRVYWDPHGDGWLCRPAPAHDLDARAEAAAAYIRERENGEFR